MSSRAAAIAMSSSSSRAAASKLLKRGLTMATKVSDNKYAPTGKWILGTAGMVVGMIHIGGVTRLTQSGLSMTTWSTLGSLPPITMEEWEVEFSRYKTFPEWQQRKDMTLSDFKFIYGWEYGHRMLGRAVGVAFIVPWTYFTIRGLVPSGYQKRMWGLVTMGGVQGLVGWWMVKSGLGDDRLDDRNEIRVRPIRLTTHLCMAVATYGALVWTGLDILGIKHERKHLAELASKMGKGALHAASRIRTGSLMLTGLTAVTVASGALVAGNDAGRAYNTFPTMDGEWIPSGIADLTPWHKNLIENTATVQFNHRVLGITTAAVAGTLVGFGLLGSSAAGGATAAAATTFLTPQARKGLMAIGVTTAAQVTLGITALLNYVPIELAAAHQLGSIAVFTSSLYTAHSLRYARHSLLLLPKTTATAGGSLAGSIAAAAGTTMTAAGAGIATATMITNNNIERP